MAYIKSKKKFLKKLRLYFIFTGILSIVSVVIFEVQVTPFEQKCILKQARSTSDKFISKAVSDTLDNYEFSYDDLAQVNYSDGLVSSITTNSYNINKIKSDVILKIQNKLDKEEIYCFDLPLGAFTGLTLINNLGPNVEINFRLIGSVNCKIKSEFESSGLNQTIHRIYLVVKTRVNVISTEYSKEQTYKSDFEIAQTIIVGDIPSAYANIDKLT